MNEPRPDRGPARPGVAHDAATSLPPWHEAAALGARIAAKLRAEAGPDAQAHWGRVLHAFDTRLARAEAEAPSPAAVPAPQPLDDLVHALCLGADERTLVVLAGMADAHEAYGAAFAALHPRGESRPTWGLYAWLVSLDAGREAALKGLHESPLLRLGIVRLTGDAPLPEQSLRLAEGLWSALHGLPVWPPGTAPLAPGAWLDGLDGWIDQSATHQALALLRPDPDTPAGAWAAPGCTVVLRGLQGAAVRLRAQQLAAAAGGFVFEWSATREASELSALLAHTLLRRAVPVLLCDAPLPPAQNALLDACPSPLVLAGTVAGSAAGSERGLWPLDAPPPDTPAQARLWARALPELAEHGPLLSARYPLWPHTLALLRQDLAPLLVNAANAAQGQRPTLEQCVAALKARMSHADESFARRIAPQCGWADLVLPPATLAPLQAAVARVRLQQRVLDDWGFERSVRGRRGLRLLFSGLPGTGKTLAAEVVAHALHADLLVIDLARLVSKWIGETEKNLAAAFDQAEATGAVLFFDEADALFGKRTEVSDAHDRYANIESSYLLARLERFDGVAILATNLRGNLDRAFMRRFEVALDFAEPGPEERAAIWRRQFPPQAPLAADVDLDRLAASFPLSGALIRNAALGSAYLAAGEGQTITRAHVERALRLEYDKSGRVCPL